MTGKELREIRKAAGMNQTEFARAIGYAFQSGVARLEKRDEIPLPLAVAVRAIFADEVEALEDAAAARGER